jgi:hypothetical protein
MLGDADLGRGSVFLWVVLGCGAAGFARRADGAGGARPGASEAMSRRVCCSCGLVVIDKCRVCVKLIEVDSVGSAVRVAWC